MFAAIETNGASHIVIYIPHDGAEKSLPALASMLEQNAVFIQRGYQDFNLVKPKMTIHLGDHYDTEASTGEDLVIKTSAHVLNENFTVATPEVMVSNAKAAKSARDEISKLRTELSFLRDKLATAEQQLNEENK